MGNFMKPEFRWIKALVAAFVFSTSFVLATNAPRGPVVRAAKTSRHSRFAKLEGMRVHYVDAGKGGTAVVFVHGWTCNADFWRLQMPAIVARTRAIAIDLPGHGLSDKPQIAYTMDLFARAIEAVLKDAGVKHAVLVGHSMGTPVVRQFYRLYPEQTAALVFVDGSLRLIFPKESMEKLLAPLRGADYETALGQIFDGMTKAMPNAALRTEVKAAVLRTPQYVAVSAGEGMTDEAIFKKDPINVPVLVILAQSPFWGPDTEQFFRSLAPDLEYHMWTGVSHFVMMDEPDKFNQTLIGFLENKGLVRK
jgi:pimeloyl-ACP methyl ester carboxylesterase